MDPETREAVDRYVERFGSINLTVVNVDFGAAGVKQRFISALDGAIADGKPVTDQDLGFTIPDGALA